MESFILPPKFQITQVTFSIQRNSEKNRLAADRAIFYIRLAPRGAVDHGNKGFSTIGTKQSPLFGQFADQHIDALEKAGAK